MIFSGELTGVAATSVRTRMSFDPEWDFSQYDA